jgi:NAD(P)-dependent dehydrogenase (short-subunit alcohol dehydrogenase family)
MTDAYGRRLEDMVLIVTGAAGDIGAQTVRRCTMEGARVLAVDADPSVIRIAAEAGAIGEVADVCDDGAAGSAVAHALDEWGRLDGLANIAGVVRFGDVMEIGMDEWRQVMDVNLNAPFAWSRACLPALCEADGGAIVNVASIAAVAALRGRAAYVVSKTGLLGLTRSIAADFGRFGVRCNSVSPGSVDTDMLRRYCAEGRGRREELEALSSLRRVGQPEDIAACCAFLFAGDSAFVNGANLVVDGGRTTVS